MKWLQSHLGISLMLTLCLSFSNIVLAEEAGNTTGIYTLGEVVVRGAREGVEGVSTVREVTAQEIQNKGARTLDQAVDLLPGVDVRVGAQGVPRINIRGYRTRQVLLLLNGIPFNSSYDGQFDPSIIPVENIAKIKLSYGSHSVLYGDGGSAGVINIVTKKGLEGVHGMADGQVGEKKSFLGRFDVSGGTKNVDFFVSGSAAETDGFPVSDDFDPTQYQSSSTRENSDRTRKNLFANVGGTPTEDLELGAVFNYLQGEFGKPPSTIDRRGDRDSFAQNVRYDRVEDFNGYSGQFSANYKVTGPLSLRAWAYVNQLPEDENRYDDDHYNSANLRGSYQQDTRTRITGGTFQAIGDFGARGLLTAGFNSRWEDWDLDRVEAERDFQFVSIEDDRNTNVYSAVIEYEISPLEKLGLVFGYGYHWFEKDDGDKENDSSYIVGAHYDILQGTRIRGAVSQQIRFPSIRQLYDPDDGNPDLDTENVQNYELGIEQRLPWNSWISLVGFYSEAEDFIKRDDLTDNQENVEKLRYRGVELTAQTFPLKNLFLGLGYTYLDVEDESPGVVYDEPEYNPRHKFTLEGKYRFPIGFSIYANWIYVGRQYHYSNDDPPLSRKLNDYQLFNFKLEQELLRGGLVLYAGVDNFFDKNYETSYGFPQAGQFLYGGARYRF